MADQKIIDNTLENGNTMLDGESSDFSESGTEKSNAVRTLVTAFNDAVTAGNASLIASNEQLLTTALKELNEEEKSVQLNNWAGLSDSLLGCLESGGTYSLTGVKKDKDLGTVELVGKSAIVDLKDLFKVKQAAFADRNWLAYSEAANIAIRDYIAKIMKISTFTEKLAGFKLSATAAMLGITVKDMSTAKGTTSALQKVVDSIMGKVDGKSRYYVESEDAEAFRYNYSQWGNKAINSVSLNMEATFRKNLTRILVKMVNNLEYIGE